jgi:hypothetical protein
MTAQPESNWRDDTITGFPAIRDERPAPAGEPCGCGMHDTPDPGTDALLSCAPGVVTRMWRTRIANGQWADIHAAWDQGHARTHMPTLENLRRIHASIAAVRHDIGAMFDRNPGLLSDAVIAEGLHDLEGRLAGRLAQMQAEAAVRGEAA